MCIMEIRPKHTKNQFPEDIFVYRFSLDPFEVNLGPDWIVLHVESLFQDL
jgi:hypothetical protein